MPLNSQLLVTGLLDLQNNQSKTQAETGQRWASMYHAYASNAIAGVMIPIGLTLAPIASTLSAVGQNQFFTKIESALSLYWRVPAWAGPGFTGVTLNSSGAGARLQAAGNNLKNSSDKNQSARILANALHLYTIGITVTMISVATGIPSIMTLV